MNGTILIVTCNVLGFGFGIWSPSRLQRHEVLLLGSDDGLHALQIYCFNIAQSLKRSKLTQKEK